MTNQLPGRLSEQSAHSRTDIAHAIFAIDLPQPADAALLIFLEKEARALALASDIGVGLELEERPSRNRKHAKDRNTEGENDRKHMLKRNGMPTN